MTIGVQRKAAGPHGMRAAADVCVSDERRATSSRQSDGGGRYDPVTLRRMEDGTDALELTADQPSAALDEAGASAAQLHAETE